MYGSVGRLEVKSLRPTRQPTSRARSRTFSDALQRLSLALERLRSRREPYARKWSSDLPAHPSKNPWLAGRLSASTAKRLRVSRKSAPKLLTGPADRA